MTRLLDAVRQAMGGGDVEVPPAGGFAGDIDAQRLLQLLVRLEADTHRRGWDRPPRLMIVYDASCAETDEALRDVLRGSGPPSRAGGYVAAQLGASSTFMEAMGPGASFDAVLGRFVYNIAYIDTDRCARADRASVLTMQLMIRAPGVVGFVAVYEAWRHRFPPGSPAPDRHLADLPGSVEGRRVLAADLRERFYSVERLRGHKPVATIFDTAERRPIGTITNAISLLRDTALARLPCSQQEFDARYPSASLLFAGADDSAG